MSQTTCKALAITCIDFRFVERQSKFLTELGLSKNYDFITVPGASKNIDQVNEPIKLSLKLHSPQEILIFDHEDCGAYGDDNGFEIHQANLQKAKAKLMQEFPDIAVKTYLSGFETIKEIN